MLSFYVMIININVLLLNNNDLAVTNDITYYIW